MEEQPIIERLAPFVEEITLWTWDRFEKAAKEQGAKPVLLAMTTRPDGPERVEAERMIQVAREKTGLFVLEIKHMFEGMDLRKLRVAPWDRHPNATGHRIIASRMMAVLLVNDEALGLGLGREARPQDKE